MSTEAKCPFPHTAGGGTSNRDWWPNQLAGSRLRLNARRHSGVAQASGGHFLIGASNAKPPAG